jgi:tetratricopeptide (TPR) repeat protein
MSKFEIKVIFISIFLSALIFWIVSEISEKIKNDQEYEEGRKKFSKIMDSVVAMSNAKMSEINYQEIYKKIEKEQEYKEDEIIKKDPKNAQAYFDRGIKKLEFRYYQGARADFDTAIELNPKFAEAYYYRSKSNILSGYNIIEDLDKAISLNPKYTEAYISRASHKIILNREGACQDLEMARRLGDTSSYSWLERFCN